MPSQNILSKLNEISTSKDQSNIDELTKTLGDYIKESYGDNGVSLLKESLGLVNPVMATNPQKSGTLSQELDKLSKEFREFFNRDLFEKRLEPLCGLIYLA